MRSAFIEIAAAILIVIVVAGARASATTYRVSPEATADSDSGAAVYAASNMTVSGRVRSTRAEWRGRRIVTRVLLEVDGSTVEFLVPGGTVDGIAMRVSGAPRFAVGEHVQVTLRHTPGGMRLTGLGTGKVVLP